jgi:tRNA(fMet)-specific endonuclease VapC
LLGRKSRASVWRRQECPPSGKPGSSPPFFQKFVSFSFDDAAAEIYGTIRARLERAGTTIGPNDLLIAAIALNQKATLVTHNTREFSRVEDLLLEDWE